MHFDLTAFFAALQKIPQLTRGDPQSGCVARAQLIGSLLHQHKLRVCRAWVLPVYERMAFHAPVDENLAHRFTPWRYHCAPCLPDLPGQPVADFPLRDHAVPLAEWEEMFRRAQHRGGRFTELRFELRPFHEVPHRRLLRDNPRAQRLNKLLTAAQLANITMLASR